MDLQTELRRKQEALERAPDRHLLEYFWKDEPVYHPEFTLPMSRAGIRRARVRASGILFVYLTLTIALLRRADHLGFATWIVGMLAGLGMADFVSGLAHIYIDFMPSNSRTPLDRELFLSRVHHHELFRPARLNLASLWESPALYTLIAFALVPFALIETFGLTPAPWVVPLWLSLLWSTAVSQITHAIAHGKGSTTGCAEVLRILQRVRLVLPAKTHRTHHRLIDRNFCVLNGWANPVLNTLFKSCIEKHLPETTSVTRQRSDIRRKLRFPYQEIL